MARWNYHEATCCHAGLINSDEQEVLRSSHVGVIGMGGVGGVDLVTLARLGIGHFTIADPDVFEMANINRQYGAMSSTLCQYKVDVMASIVRDINPTVDLHVMRETVGPRNIGEFMYGVDVLVDGIDAFAVDTRRMAYRYARDHGIYALGAGPVGFSTVWVVFSPNGMTFDEYFDLRDGMDHVDMFAAYIVGMAPKATHRSYMDLTKVDVASHRGGSLGLACQLSGGVVAAEVAKILLGRGPVRCAPCYHQFDAYWGRLATGRLRWGNRGPLQRIKRRVFAGVLRTALGGATGKQKTDTVSENGGGR